jgi:hypothetical protein
MHATPNPSQLPSADELIETWLIRQVTPSSAFQHIGDALPRLPPQTGSERLASVREVLDRRPGIAGYARRLSVHDQLRLTIEGDGNRTASSIDWTTVVRCSGSKGGARRAARTLARDDRRVGLDGDT